MFGMAFLMPAFLAGLVAAALPVLLHLLKRDAATRRNFSAVFLIKRTPVEQTGQRRLRELNLLALRVTALALLALAFARPYLTGVVAGTGGGLTVVAIDRSFSMSGPGQLDRARELASDAVRAVRLGERVAVVVFDETAVLLSEPSPERQQALAAIEGLSVGWGATRYRVGLGRAAEVIGAQTGRIVVVTDLQRSGWGAGGQGVVPDRIAVEVTAVESPVGNLAVTAVKSGALDTRASILNGGATARLATLRLLVDGAEVDRTMVTVPAGVSSEVVFPVVLPQHGEASVVVEDGEGYEADDARHLLLVPQEALKVVLVTSSGDSSTEAFYLDQALRVAGAVNQFEIVQTAAVRLSLTLAQVDASPPAVLLLTSRGLDRRGLAALEAHTRAGGGVLIVAGPDMEPVTLSGLGGVGKSVPVNDVERPMDQRLVPTDGRHPIFKALGQRLGNLAQVRYGRIRVLDSGQDGRVLARFSDGGAALVEYGLKSGRLLVFGSDLDDAWNDFPRHPMFVPFVHEMLKYLSGNRREQREWLVGDGPAASVSLPGFTALADSQRVAINVDRAESDPARMSVEEFGARVAQLRGAVNAATPEASDDQERGQGYWRYGLGLMALALAAESLLGSRMD